jgi:hypothetical protein
LWNVDPSLGINHEISNYTIAIVSNGSANKHVSTASRKYSNNGRDVFCAVHAEML